MAVKKFFSAIFESLKRDFWRKMLALLFAFILWSYIMVESNPTRRKEVKNLRVNVVGTEQLASYSVTVPGGLDEAVFVSAIIEAEQNDHRYINTNNVTATVDLSSITAEGDTNVAISVDTKYGLVKSVYPSTIKVSTEQIIERTVPVTYEYVGEAVDGCYVAEPQFYTDSITINGAESVIEKVSEARCYISIVGLDKSITKSFSTTLINYSGKKVEYTDEIIGGTPYVVAKIDVENRRTIPVDCTLTGTNIINLPENYEVIKITAEPESLSVSGKEALLDTIEVLNITSVNLRGKTGSFVVNATVEKLDGVNYIDSRTISVSVTVREKQIEKTFRNVPVYIKDETNYTLSDTTTDVTVKGGATAINSLNSGSFKLYADVSNMIPGTYTVDIKSEAIEGVELTLSKSVLSVTVGG